MKNTSKAFLLILTLLLLHSVTSQTTTIQNCLNYTSQIYCSVCENDLKPNVDATSCVTCDVQNCQVCVGNDQCKICQPGFTLYLSEGESNGTANGTANGTSTNCFECNIDNCKVCSDNDVCETCIDGFTLDEGECGICTYPCATCNANLTCATCVEPFYFKTPGIDGECFASTIANCLDYNLDNTTQCTQCENFYKLVNNTCKSDCEYPCLACTGTDCSTCAEGYYLNSSTKACNACPFGCQNCDNQGLCLKTKGGFFVIDGVISICPWFCASCTSATSCTQFKDIMFGWIFFWWNGQFRLASCEDGCQSCSPNDLTKCNSCKSGFALNTISQKCLRCDSLCKTCATDNSSKCLSCYPKTFKSGDTCVSCNQKCLTCQGASNLDVCTSCKNGFYLDETTCIQGTLNQCEIYISGTSCRKCSTGYTIVKSSVSGNNECAQCLSSCRSCSSGNAANCLSCGDGSYLKGSKCVSCPSYCKTCNSAGCSQCYNGYKMNSDKTCTQKCKQPCSDCGSSPTSCTSCILGYKLSGSGCLPDVSCDGSCQFCPLGYVLSNSSCLACEGTGCRTCLNDDLAACSSCVSGYYLDAANSACVSCPNSCKTCVSETVCSSCADGYTSTATSILGSGFICLACSSECATCLQSPQKCITCASGYELNGWKCIKKVRFIFGCRLNCGLGFFFGRFFGFMRALIFSFKRPLFTKCISFDRIYQGSVVVEGSVDPNEDSGSSGFNDEYNGLSTTLTQGNYLDGMQIMTSSVGIANTSPTTSSDNLGLILGICIPVGILILASIILVIYKVNTKNKMYSEQGDKDDKAAESQQGFSAQSKYDL